MTITTIIDALLETAPVNEPLSLDEVKNHLRIELNDVDYDDYLTGLILVAREHAEDITWRKLITQSWYTYLSDWPSGNYIELPFGELQSVTAIKYTDVDAAQTEWSDAEYIVGTNYQRGRVTLGDGYTWPNVNLYPSSPIEVNFICGYGDDRVDVPASIRHAMKLLISDLFENREIAIIGTIVSKLDTVNSLLTNYRLNEL
jgi:uncharacterized phiE125 gp8 family phage protein